MKLVHRDLLRGFVGPEVPVAGGDTGKAGLAALETTRLTDRYHNAWGAVNAARRDREPDCVAAADALYSRY